MEGSDKDNAKRVRFDNQPDDNIIEEKEDEKYLQYYRRADDEKQKNMKLVEDFFTKFQNLIEEFYRLVDRKFGLRQRELETQVANMYQLDNENEKLESYLELLRNHIATLKETVMGH